MVSVFELLAAGIKPHIAQLFEEPLQIACERFQINSPLRLAHFLAQCAHESSGFERLSEDMYYTTPAGIKANFKAARALPDAELEQRYCRRSVDLANFVYANRLGNGDEASGDGHRYRGGGLIHLTGRANYMAAGGALARPYKDKPELVRLPLDAALTAAWHWDVRRINEAADADDVDKATELVNGPKKLHLAERKEWLMKFRKALCS